MRTAPLEAAVKSGQWRYVNGYVNQLQRTATYAEKQVPVQEIERRLASGGTPDARVLRTVEKVANGQVVERVTRSVVVDFKFWRQAHLAKVSTQAKLAQQVNRYLEDPENFVLLEFIETKAGPITSTKEQIAAMLASRGVDTTRVAIEFVRYVTDAPIQAIRAVTQS